MAEADKVGFEIDSVFYPMPAAFRLGDTLLVQELLPAGVSYMDFAEALDDEDERKNPIYLPALVAVAVWQKHKTWKRSKVVKYVEQVDFDAFEMVGGDEPEPEDDARPPDESSTASSENLKPSLDSLPE